VSDPVATLERVCFLEWRVEQLTCALEDKERLLQHQRVQLAESAQREAEATSRVSELERLLAEVRREAVLLGDRRDLQADLEERFGDSERANLQAARVVRELERERERASSTQRALEFARERITILESGRERFFAKLITWQRMGQGQEGADLAQFIAELRAEVSRLSSENAALTDREGHLLRELQGLRDRGVELAEPQPFQLPGDPPAVATDRSSPATAAPAVSATAGHLPLSAGDEPVPEGAPTARSSVLEPEASQPRGDETPVHRRAAGADLVRGVPEGVSGDAQSFELANASAHALDRDAAELGAEEEVAWRFAEPDLDEAASPSPAQLAPAALHEWIERIEQPEPEVAAGAPLTFSEVRQQLRTSLGTESRVRNAERLLLELFGANAALRRGAARALVHLAGELAAPGLSLAFHAGTESDERVELLGLMARTGAAQVGPTIRTAQRDEDPKVRAAALDALAQHVRCDAALLREPLEDALADADARVRRRAVMVLCSLPRNDAANLLARVLEDPDPQLRRAACAGLSQVDSPAIQRLLAGVLLDREPFVRRAAALALRGSFGAEVSRVADASESERRRQVAALRERIARREGPQATGREPDRASRLADVLARSRRVLERGGRGGGLPRRSVVAAGLPRGNQ